MNDKLLPFLVSATVAFLSASAVLATPDQWLSLIDSGIIESTKGNYVQAEKLYSEAFKLVEPFGSKDLRYIISSTRLAEIYRHQRKYDQSVDAYQRVIAAQEKYYGPDDPQIALTLKSFISMYCSKSDYARAEPLSRRVLSIDEKNFGSEHPEVVIDLVKLSTILCYERKFDEAEILLKRTLAIQEKSNRTANLNTMDVMCNLAGLNYTQGKFALALPLYESVLASKTKMLGESHPEVIASLRDLAMLYKAKGEYKEAIEYCEKAHALTQKLSYLSQPQLINSLNLLANAYCDATEFDRARPLYLRILKMREAKKSTTPAELDQAFHSVISTYLCQNKIQEAKPYLDKLKSRQLKDPESKVAKSKDPKAFKNAVIGYNNLGVLCLNCKQNADAEKCFTRAISIDPSYGLAYENRAIVRKNLGDEKAAAHDREKATLKGFGRGVVSTLNAK